MNRPQLTIAATKNQGPFNLGFHRAKRDAERYAWHKAGLPWPARALLMEIIKRSNQAWRGVWASQSQLAKGADISKASVKRHMRHLERAGLVRRIGLLHTHQTRRPIVVYECGLLTGHYNEAAIQETIAPSATGRFQPGAFPTEQQALFG